MTMGGNLIHSLDDIGTAIEDLLTVNLLFDSLISTSWTKIRCRSTLKNLPKHPPQEIQVFWIKLTNFPEDITHQYNPQAKVTLDG